MKKVLSLLVLNLGATCYAVCSATPEIPSFLQPLLIAALLGLAIWSRRFWRQAGGTARVLLVAMQVGLVAASTCLILLYVGSLYVNGKYLNSKEIEKLPSWTSRQLNRLGSMQRVAMKCSQKYGKTWRRAAFILNPVALAGGDPCCGQSCPTENWCLDNGATTCVSCSTVTCDPFASCAPDCTCNAVCK